MSSAKQLRRWIWAPWSLVVWFGGIAWMMMTSTFIAFTTVFVPFERSHHYLGGPATKSVMLLTLSRIRVFLDPQYDRKRVSMYTQNHVSVFDGHIGVWAIPAVFCGLENAAHLRVPGYGWMMRMANAIPVEPRSATRFQDIAKAFRNRASRGISILTFPEGHRTTDGKMRAFRQGAFRIAADVGLPVVPLAMRGMWDLCPKGSWIVKPSLIECYVGPQFETAGLSEAEVDILIVHVRRVMEAWLERREQTGEHELAAFRAAIAARRQAATQSQAAERAGDSSSGADLERTA